MVRILVYSILLGMLAPITVLAAPASFSYQGQIIKPDSQPLEAPSVTFTVDILSPNAEACLLFQETHTINMSGSNGLFSLEVGSGTRVGTDYEDTNPLGTALSNSTGLVTPTTCASVGTYNPATSDGRKLRITFDDGSGPTTLSQDHNIVSVPYAANASSIDGLSVGDLVRINNGGGVVLTQSNLESVFGSAAMVTELLALINGTSTQYSSGAPTAPVNMNSQRVTNVATPTGATDAANKDYADDNVGGRAVDTTTVDALGAGQSGQVLTWNGTQWTSSAPSGDSTKLPLAGGTMSGTLNMGNQDISNIKDVAVNNDVAIGNDLAVTNNISVTGGIGVGTGINSNGTITVENQNIIRFGDADSASVADIDYVGFRAPAVIAAPGTIWTLPAADGTAGQILSTDGSGVLSWVSDSAPIATVFGRTGTITAATSDYDAVQVDNTAAGTISATNVQAAINELDTEKVAKAGDRMTGNLQLDATNEVRFADADSSNYVGFASPGIVGSNQIWVLPNVDGNSGEYLQTDGSGQLTFAPAPTAPVTSVYGRTGVVTAATSDYDAIQVDNTAAGTISATNVQAAINELDTEKVATTRTLSTAADSGLTGGGDLSANRSLSLDIPGTTDLGAPAVGADSLLIYDASGTAIREVTRTQLVLSESEVDAFVANNGYAADADKVNRSGDTMTGDLNLDNEQEVRFSEADGNGTNYVGFKAATTLAANQIWTLPIADGTSGQVLQTDGSGNLSFVAIASAPVATVFGRTGTVVAATSDYDAIQVDNTAAGTISATNVQAAINELDTEKVATTRTLSTAADSGLAGGGDLSANRSLTLDIPGTTDLGAPAVGADSLLIYDASGTAIREVTRTQLVLSESEVDAFVGNNGYAADADKVNRAGDTMTGDLNLDNEQEIRFSEADGSGANYVGFKAAATLAADQIWTLPIADGTAGQVLQTDGSGNLSFVAIASAPVASVFGRTGTVTAATSDYDAIQVDNTAAGTISATNVQAAINELDTEKVATTRTLSTAADSGLTGGGDLSSNRSLSLDIPGTTDLGAPAVGADSLLIYDASGTAIREVTRTQLVLSESEVDAFVGNNGYAADADKVNIAGDAMTGNLTMNATSEVRFADSDSSNYVGFASPAIVSSDQIWTLPAADGTSGQVLQTNGSGILSWTTTSAGVTDHGALTGLTDDDHTQYVLLAGRAGGQSLIGGTAAGNDLTLESTSNASKGDIILQPNGGFVGIGTATPAVALDVNTGSINAAEICDENNAGCLDLSDFSLRKEIPAAGGEVLYVRQTAVDAATGLRGPLLLRNDGTGGANELNLAGVDASGSLTSSIRQDGGAYFDGNVGVGTTTPNEKLTLEGGMSFKEMTAPTTDVATYHKLYVDTADDKLKFRDESGTVTDLITADANKVDRAGDTMTGDLNLDNEQEVRFSEADGSGTNYVGFKAATTLAANQIWTLPVADGTAGQVLQTDGSGNLSFVPIASAPVATVFGRTGTVVAATSDYDAIQIDNTPAGTIAATNVQAAIDELDTEKVATTTTLTTAADSGLTGGGDLSANRSLSLDIPGTTNLGAPAAGADTLLLYDASGTALREVTRTQLVLSESEVDAFVGNNGYAADSAKVNRAGDAMTGNLTMNATTEVRFADADSSNHVGFASPAIVSSDQIWTLPAADGTSGQVLQTNGSGILSWTTAGGGASFPLRGPNGTVGAPSYSFSADNQSGMFYSGGGVPMIAHSVGGVARTVTSQVGFTATADVSAPYTPTSGSSNLPVTGQFGIANQAAANSSAGSLVLGVTNASGDSQAGYMAAISNAAGDTPDIVIGQQTGGSAYNERVRIDTAGNLGIGTTNPGERLDIEGSVLSGPKGTAAGEGGAIKLEELAANGTNSVGFRAPDSVASNVLWQLPSADGTSGQVLQTDGSGVLSWATASGADNLGNHTATSTVQLNNQWLSNDGGSEGIRINNSGDVGIGTATMAARLDVQGGSTAAKFVSSNSTAFSVLDGLQIETTATGSMSAAVGIDSITRVDLDGGNLSEATGARFFVLNPGNSPTSALTGVRSVVEANSGDVTNVYGLSTSVSSDTLRTVNNAYGAYFEYSAAGTINTGYGVYVEDIPATTGYAFYQAGTNDINYFAGSLGIGTTSPGERLDVEGSVLSGPKGTAAGEGGAIKLEELAANGTNSVGFRAPDSVASNVLWQLPSADGTSGQVLQTNGSGILSWTTAGGGSPSFPLRGPDGTTGAPSYSFSGDTDMGMARNSGRLRLQQNASWYFDIGSGSLALSDVFYYDMTSGLSFASNTASIEMNRIDSTVTSGETLAELKANANDGFTIGGDSFLTLNASQARTASAKGNTLSFYTIPNGSTTPVERMTLMNSGNVGIGTTVPSQKLDVEGSIVSGPSGTGAGSGGSISFEELAANGTNSVGFRAPDSVASNVLWQLPGADGTSGQVLQTNGSGVLTWASVAGGSGDFMADGSVPMTDQFLGSVGNAGAPGITYDGDTDTGFFRPGANQLGLSTAGSERIRVDASGNVGIGTSVPRATLDVDGTIVSKPATGNATSTVDFANGNIQYTNASCGTFALHNLKDGGVYTFIVKGATAATCVFNTFSDAGSTGLTEHYPPDHGATTVSTHTVYSLMVAGGDVYIAWVPGM